MLYLADRYSVPSLKARCEVELASSLNVDNAALLFKYGKTYKCDRLSEVTLYFIEEYFNQVIETQAFEDLDKEQMLEIMRFSRSHK